MVFYRKYRPQKFSEVVGQEHVVQTLRGALLGNQLAHAYLFTGPRGTGKTTLARLLAKAANCSRLEDGDVCNRCDFCREVSEGRALDLMEIDAASNRGVDEIRSLREGVRFASLAGRHKVYVIDECHQLTKEASNALLKTLEEPPAKTLFILATTELHKVLPTIISRVQKFDFKKLTMAQISAKLAEISRQEKIKITPDLLRLIARQSEGSLRDAESQLAKLVAFSGQEINEQAVEEILGLIPDRLLFDFTAHLAAHRPKEALALINQIYQAGLDLEHFTKGLLEKLRLLLVLKTNPQMLTLLTAEWGEETGQQLQILGNSLETKQILSLMQALLRARQEIKISPIPQLPLEILVAEYA